MLFARNKTSSLFAKLQHSLQYRQPQCVAFYVTTTEKLASDPYMSRKLKTSALAGGVKRKRTTRVHKAEEAAKIEAEYEQRRAAEKAKELEKRMAERAAAAAVAEKEAEEAKKKDEEKKKAEKAKEAAEKAKKNRGDRKWK